MVCSVLTLQTVLISSKGPVIHLELVVLLTSLDWLRKGVFCLQECEVADVCKES